MTLTFGHKAEGWAFNSTVISYESSFAEYSLFFVSGGVSRNGYSAKFANLETTWVVLGIACSCRMWCVYMHIFHYPHQAKWVWRFIWYHVWPCGSCHYNLVMSPFVSRFTQPKSFIENHFLLIQEERKMEENMAMKSVQYHNPSCHWQWNHDGLLGWTHFLSRWFSSCRIRFLLLELLMWYTYITQLSTSSSVTLRLSSMPPEFRHPARRNVR
jgi:hypothetical protein